MYERVDASQLKDLLLPISRRPGRGVYFVRVCGWRDGLEEDLWACHRKAQRRGVIVEGQLSNPDGRQLSYMADELGTDFDPGVSFLREALDGWMPRMDAARREALARLMGERFEALERQGKTRSIQRNLYSKLMCWLYYRFERLTPFLGSDDAPCVLYECAGITSHELELLRLLNAMGADILLLELSGDGEYLKRDPGSEYSQLLVSDATAFPQGFCLKQLRRRMERPEAAPQRPAVKRGPAGPSDPSGASGRIPERSDLPGAPGRRPDAPVARATVVQKPVRLAPGGVARPDSPIGRVRQPGAESLRRPQPRAIDPRDYFRPPRRAACTNAWMQTADYRGILTPVADRGDDPGLFYNAFIRVRGVTDKLTYLSQLRRFYRDYQATGRRIAVVDNGLSTPEPREIAQIRRRVYRRAEEMIVDLAGNLPACASAELTRQQQRAFVDTMLEAAKSEPALSRLLSAAVCLLCWIRRYHARLFGGYREGDVACFVLMGGCRGAGEALYPLFLSRLPVDVLILAPDLSRSCALEDDRLLELTGRYSLPTMAFPRDAGALQLDTLAAHAEAELDDVLYGDSGLYRDRQFSKAEAMTLRTTYDELFLLWDQELKYRPGFEAADQSVTMPVLYAKVSGVERGDPDAYWQKIRLLTGEDTLLARRMPMRAPGSANARQALAVKCLRDGRLNRAALLRDRQYPFGFIRTELQRHMLDKLQLMLDRRLIRGTFENGAEYTVVATVLDMGQTLLRMLQRFDFTKRNPKLVCVCADDRAVSLEDAILITFLNLVGFDIALFVPTGYLTVERYLNDNLPVEHQAGEYLYDLTPPDIEALPRPRERSWLTSLFRRGR